MNNAKAQAALSYNNDGAVQQHFLKKSKGSKVINVISVFCIALINCLAMF